MTYEGVDVCSVAHADKVEVMIAWVIDRLRERIT